MHPFREQPPDLDRPIIVVALNGRVVGLDRESGAARWDTRLPGGPGGPVFVAFRLGVLVVSANDLLVYRLDYLTGDILWRRPTASDGRATLLIEPELIVVAKGGTLDAFDHQGEKRWQQRLPWGGVGPAALALPGNVAQADDVGGE